MATESSRGAILLVEDNPDNQDIYSTILQHHGYQVRAVSSGEEALEAVRSFTPDLVLLDISLPGIDGWAVRDRLRDDPATRGVPVVALTAHGLPEDYRRAEKMGFDGFIVKPVRPREVIDEVDHLLPSRS